ncbi:MAG: GTPase [Alphaproteobacteria bacterium]
MRLKSFHGATISDAMRQVRDAFGDDAIIVATRDDDQGGVRVTAAVDEAPGQAVALPDIESGEDIIERVSDALFRHGVHAGLAEKLLATATNFAEDDPVIALAAGFDAHIPFRTPSDAPRPIVLIGPPGSGKTLAVAKLATAARIKDKPLAVITTDLVRAGGVDQLAAYTNVMKIKLLEIEEAQAAADAVAEMTAKNIVLVDTAGCNPFDPAARDELQALIRKINGDIVMALPCGLDSEDGIDLAQTFKKLGATQLLFTRADVTRRFGSTLNIAGASGLELAYLSQSANVTTPLLTMNPITLARFILEPPAVQQRNDLPQTGTHA